MRRNIKLMKYYFGASLPFMLGPILLSFYQHRGLEVSGFYVLMYVSLLSVFLFEVPTGMIADRIGYKRSLIIGTSLMATSMLIHLLSYSIWGFIFSEIVFACGLAFRSGADSALVYDTLVELEEEERYIHIFSKIRSNIFVFAGIGSVISSVIYKANTGLPIVINMLMNISAVIVLFFIKEPKHVKEKEQVGFKEQLNFVATNVRNSKYLVKVIVISSFLHGFYRINFNQYQPYLVAKDIDIVYYGLIFALLNAVAFISANNSKRILNYIKGNYFMFLFVVIFSSFALLTIPISYYGFIGMILAQLFRSLYGPMITEMVNRVTSSNVRATTLSVVSLFKSIVAALLAFIVSLYVDYVTCFENTMLISIAIIVIFVIMNLLFRDIKKLK